MRFAAAGAKVILTSRNESALSEAASEIESKGGRATFAAADVADPEQLKSAAEKGIAKFGRDRYLGKQCRGRYVHQDPGHGRS